MTVPTALHIEFFAFRLKADVRVEGEHDSDIRRRPHALVSLPGIGRSNAYCETFGRSPTGIMMWAYGVPFHIT